MFNKKEIAYITIVTILLAFLTNLLKDQEIFLISLLSIFIIIMVNILVKKITAYYLDSKIEINLWELKRYGFSPKKAFKNAFPAGAFIPVISKLILFPFNNFVWMASLVFEVKAKIYKAAKRHGTLTFSEITEYQIGLIAASGICVNLLLAIAGYLVGFELFSKLNIYYAFFNMFPISDLDGNKIFFGNLTMWAFLATITLIGMLAAMFVI